MKPSSRLCPQCQRPLISNEMFCSWCNTYSPEARPNTTRSFPQPPPQYTGFPGQSWPPTGLMEGFPGGKILPESRPVRKKLNRLLLAGGMLGVCLLLIMASFFIGEYLGANKTSGTRVPHPGNVATSPHATPTQAAPLSMAPTALPTASLSSPQLPLKISCVNCPYPQLTVTLNSIEVDAPARSTRWVFSLLNSGSHSCSGFNSHSIGLTDAIGTDYQGNGQVESDFAMNAGQSVQEISLFSVLPTAGAQYTLQLQIDISRCDNDTTGGFLVDYHNAYQTENFTFA